MALTFTYKVIQVLGSLVLRVNYSDGSFYYQTGNAFSIRNFFKAVGHKANEGTAITAHIIQWYKFDMEQGLECFKEWA